MNLFIYGTLLVPPIWEAVTGEAGASSIPARLSGYRIRRVRGADFPGIAEDPAATEAVPGRVVLSLAPATLRRLDLYESDLYERVPVRPEAEGRLCEAEAYVVPAGRAGELLSDDLWTLERFRREALASYWLEHFEPTLE